MALEIPTFKEIYSRNIADVEVSYNAGKDPEEQIDPSQRNSIEGAITYALSQQADSLYKTIEIVVRQLFVTTADGEFLDRLAVERGVTRNPATVASGFVTFTGTVSGSIPLATVLSRSDGLLYETKASALIASQVFSVSSLTRSGTTATATTATDHRVAIGMQVTMAGADQTEYNGTFTVTSVSSDTSFSYTVSGSPVTPATGTITMSFDGVSVEVESQDSGQDVNIVAGGVLTLSTPIVNVDNTVYVQFSEVSGGTDEESDEDFRARIIFKIQNPAPPNSETDIENRAKEVSGVTRVWVFSATPASGQITTYFVRDDDDNIIPSSGEVDAVKDKLLERKPAHMSNADFIVSAPTPVSINITFSSLSPNTTEMRNAINANLDDFFRSDNDVSVDITLLDIENTIYNTIDDLGNRPVFALSLPSGDTTINDGEIGVLGAITYP